MPLESVSHYDEGRLRVAMDPERYKPATCKVSELFRKYRLYAFATIGKANMGLLEKRGMRVVPSNVLFEMLEILQLTQLYAPSPPDSQDGPPDPDRPTSPGRSCTCSHCLPRPLGSNSSQDSHPHTTATSPDAGPDKS